MDNRLELHRVQMPPLPFRRMVMQRARLSVIRTHVSLVGMLQIDVHTPLRKVQFYVTDAPVLVEAEKKPVMVVELHGAILAQNAVP